LPTIHLLTIPENISQDQTLTPLQAGPLWLLLLMIHQMVNITLTGMFTKAILMDHLVKEFSHQVNMFTIVGGNLPSNLLVSLKLLIILNQLFQLTPILMSIPSKLLGTQLFKLLLVTLPVTVLKLSQLTVF